MKASVPTKYMIAAIIFLASIAFADANEGYRNIALMTGARTTQSSSAWSGSKWLIASKAVDNNFDTYSHTRGHSDEYWQLTFPKRMYIDQVILYNRRDCCWERLDGARVTVDGAQIGTVRVMQDSRGPPYRKEDGYKFDAKRRGKVIKVNNNNYIHLAEVQVLGSENEFSGRASWDTFADRTPPPYYPDDDWWLDEIDSV